MASATGSRRSSPKSAKPKWSEPVRFVRSLTFDTAFGRSESERLRKKIDALLDHQGRYTTRQD
jgi:hypothetical protein